MRLSEIRDAFFQVSDSIKNNKLRSFLSTLGVVIGISVVILMGWMIQGLDDAMEDAMKFTGEDLLYVDKWPWAGSDNWKEIRQRKPISLYQAEKLADKMEASQIVYPIAWQHNASIKFEEENVNEIILQGLGHEFSETPTCQLEYGRMFSEFEEKIGAPVIVLAWDVYELLFKDTNPVGKYVRTKGHKLKIIGVMKKQGNLFNDFSDRISYMPLNTLTKIYGRFNRSYSICVKAGAGGERLDFVREEIIAKFREIRNLKPHQKNDFDINESKTFEKEISTFRTIISSIGYSLSGLSFIVGIIGIMNIMFVSVTERIKEIGIRKALGAKKSSILAQFLIESSLLCLFGALASLIICSILIFIAVTALQSSSSSMDFLSVHVPTKIFITASILSIFVGLLAGLMPAIRAAWLDPVDALRHD